MELSADDNTKAADRIADADKRSLTYVEWKTVEPIALEIGDVRASGDASPQVRRPERAAALGDLEAQAGEVEAIIVQALAGVLASMQPTVGQLAEWRDEIASATLVSANTWLAAYGMVLLDLSVDELNAWP